MACTQTTEYAILWVAGMTVQFHSASTKSPPSCALGGFSILFSAGQRITPQACCQMLSRQAICKGSGRLPLPRQREGMAVQCSPFASTSFPCRYGDGNASSIAYFAAKMNPQRTAPLTDEEIEAELADYRAELLAEEKARSASEDGNAKRA